MRKGGHDCVDHRFERRRKLRGPENAHAEAIQRRPLSGTELRRGNRGDRRRRPSRCRHVTKRRDARVQSRNLPPARDRRTLYFRARGARALKRRDSPRRRGARKEARTTFSYRMRICIAIVRALAAVCTVAFVALPAPGFPQGAGPAAASSPAPSAGPTAGPGALSVPFADPYPSTYVPFPSRATLIVHATILTAAGPTIRNGSILLRNGKIAAVGANVGTPADLVDDDRRARTVRHAGHHRHPLASGRLSGAQRERAFRRQRSDEPEHRQRVGRTFGVAARSAVPARARGRRHHAASAARVRRT